MFRELSPYPPAGKGMGAEMEVQDAYLSKISDDTIIWVDQ